MLTLLKYFMRFYSAKNFLRFFGTWKSRLGFLREALMLFFCLRDSRTPNFVRFAIIGALGYLITPLDMLPDFITGLGWLDDAAVIAAVMRLAGRYILPEHVTKAKTFFPGP